MINPSILDQDLGAKWALRHQAPRLATFLANHPAAVALDSQTVELQYLRRTPDHILRVRHPLAGDRLYLFEVQSRVDTTLPRRLAAASMILHQQTGLPVAPVVLYTGRVGKKRPGPVRWEVDGLLCHVPFREIILADRDAREELEQGPDSPWWPFIPFMKGGRQRSVLEPMIRCMADREDQLDHLDHVIGLAGNMLDRSWVQRVLEGTMWDKVTGRHLRKGSIHHYLKEKWTGEAKAEGKAEGASQEALVLARRAIARRFGMPDEQMSRRLEGLELLQLEALIEEFAFLNSREALEAWLDRTMA